MTRITIKSETTRQVLMRAAALILSADATVNAQRFLRLASADTSLDDLVCAVDDAQARTHDFWLITSDVRDAKVGDVLELDLSDDLLRYLAFSVTRDLVAPSADGLHDQFGHDRADEVRAECLRLGEELSASA